MDNIDREIKILTNEDQIFSEKQLRKASKLEASIEKVLSSTTRKPIESVMDKLFVIQNKRGGKGLYLHYTKDRSVIESLFSLLPPLSEAIAVGAYIDVDTLRNTDAMPADQAAKLFRVKEDHPVILVYKSYYKRAWAFIRFIEDTEDLSPEED